MLTTFEFENISELPDGLLDTTADQLHHFLHGPTLIHIQGRQQQPLFVSVLLHGNEDTGWEAVRHFLQGQLGKTLPRSLSLLIGNVVAAKDKRRRLDNQQDFNRIWGEGNSPEHKMAQQVIQQMRDRNVYASIDIHNNTGLNPHYACVNKLDHHFFHLATLFSRTVVYFIRPSEVQSNAFSKLCPAVTVECGQPGQESGTHHAQQFIEAAIHLTEFPQRPVPKHDIDLYHTMATVKVPESVAFGFGCSFFKENTDLCFSDEIDSFNFRQLVVGTTFAHIADEELAALDVIDEEGSCVFERYFKVDGNTLKTKIPFMPSMLTTSKEIVRQDCLCYLMEALDVPES